MTKWLAFDIETSQGPPTAHEGSYAIGVTCAVTQIEGAGPIRWHGEAQPNSCYALRMSATEVRALALYLVQYAASGYRIVGLNSLGFDLRVLAEESQDQYIFAHLRDVALEHYDPCFQMFCQRGFPVGLNALAKGFGLEGKTEGMDGETAAAIWSGSRQDQEDVLAYCEQDVKTTLDVALNIESAAMMKWISKKGKRLFEAATDGLLTVSECMALPLPDTGWMERSGREPWAREKFSGWIEETQCDKKLF